MHERRAQAALDTMVAYGVAILLIAISIYVILQLGIFNSRIVPSYCNPSPSFTCTAFALSPGGRLTVIFAQSTGVTLNITGIACSSTQNTISTGPKYGNVYVLPYKSASQYYPTSQTANGIVVYSSNQTRITVNCYSNSGLAKGALGNTFSGFVWINYTISTLPSNYSNVQQIVSFSAKYS